MTRTLHCYAEGQDGDWKAICLDLDIAVQGRTFEEVFASLREAIALHLESVADFPESERQRLLHRSVPLTTRLKLLWQAARDLLGREGGQTQHHQFTMPRAAWIRAYKRPLYRPPLHHYNLCTGPITAFQSKAVGLIFP